MYQFFGIYELQRFPIVFTCLRKKNAKIIIPKTFIYLNIWKLPYDAVISDTQVKK